MQVLGRRRVVHLAPRGAQVDHRHRVQGPGETNTDDLSPAPDAWSRPDIPLHYLAMLKNPPDASSPREDGKRGPMKFIEDLKKKGHLVAYVGDVVGTGSSRKSATNSVIWATGEDIPFVPNKRFWRRHAGRQDRADLLQHAGRLGRAADRGRRVALEMGDVIDMQPYDGKISRTARRSRVRAQERRCCSTRCAPAAAST